MEDTDSKLETIKTWLGAGSVNIFGRQYSGKDTQCGNLMHDFSGAMFSGGDILRKSAPQHVMEKVNAGHLSPTEEYRAIVTPYFSKTEFAGKPLFLSTVGRMKGEEETILRAAQESGHAIKAVIVLHIDESIVWQRFEASKGTDTREVRADDDSEALERRLAIYNDSTMAVIDAYRALGLVIDINGSQPPATVHTAIIDALYEKAVAATSS